MRRLVILCGAINTIAMQANAGEIDWDASIALNLAAHIAGAEPDFSDRGGQFNLEFTQDNKS